MNGPRYSIATAAPRGILRDRLVEALVHERDRDSERERSQPLLRRPVRRFGRVNAIKTTAPRRKRQALVADGPTSPKTCVTIAADHWINDAPSNM